MQRAGLPLGGLAFLAPGCTTTTRGTLPSWRCPQTLCLGWGKVQRLRAHTVAKCRGISDWNKLYSSGQASLLDHCRLSVYLESADVGMSPSSASTGGDPGLILSPDWESMQSVFRCLQQTPAAWPTCRQRAWASQKRFCHFPLKIYARHQVSPTAVLVTRPAYTCF